jgi:UDP-galactopyranose mutase
MKKVLVIGGGFAGCAMSHALHLSGNYEVLIVEKSNTLGAGVRTYFSGGHPYTFGPRHFLTKDKKLFDFFNKYVPMRDCKKNHRYLTYVESDNQFYSMPLSYDDIEIMPDKEKIYNELNEIKKKKNEPKNLEEFWKFNIGNTLYDKVVKDYNKKMWMVDDNKVFTSFGWSTKGDPIKSGKRDAFDSPDVFSAYPIALDGYNSYFDIATKGSKVFFNTSLDECDLKNKKVKIKGQEYKFDYIINTISPDELFQNDIGELKYIGRDLHTVILPMEYCFPDGVYFLYYANKEKYTRIVEYKKFSLHKSNTTLIGIEFPSNNGKFYPMPLTSEQDLAQKYFDRFPEQTFSIGRNGSYRYSVDIDDSIEQALLVAELIKKNQWEHAIPLEKHRNKNFSSMGKN